MQSVVIEILNPKAKKLLQNLADLKLISFTENGKSNKSLKSLLKKLRSKSSTVPSLDEITKEVESVRRRRYGK